jgi:hypothetical protein
MEPRDDAEFLEEERIGKWIDLMSTDLQMKVRQSQEFPITAAVYFIISKSTTLTQLKMAVPGR